MMNKRVHIKLETLIDTSVVRYCSACKAKVVFRDSKVKRHNANGKNIYMFAIYKCENGHTWNKVLDKLDSDVAHLLEYDTREQYHYNFINDCMTLELNQVKEIKISSEGKKMRIDKLLHHVSDLSRQAVNHIIEKKVTLNGMSVTAKEKVKHGDIINICDEIS